MALGTATPPFEPRFDAGRICLDLLATTHPAERLDSVEALRAWIVGAGLVPAGTSLEGVGPSWLPEFRRLRRDLGVSLRPDDTAAPCPRALARLNDAARAATPAPRAVLRDDGTLVRELAVPVECAGLLAVVARDAVELLTDPVALAAVRVCEGEDCPLVYLDTSRGRRRRWCSSEVCGNRERVARHRRRVAAHARG
ncbi:CGNR zinc finger domain-containing protein [Streptomyces sp. LP11]|uniref:CGNR zinc finger domain-containing protein n=1 Tax=Streptomyces pyxinicus TaxID=2970331 RepID=A0ABT2B376_9ACTN|nr:CGNR zinc finger domain-containing protein [Streptomyces sp. LP11]MCS0602535.1 CGNR zinc finger domain-containing protein [Streptomyces sp. LP11]